MFLPPPPGNDDDKNQFSDKPLPASISGRTPNPETPGPEPSMKGEELFQHILECLDKGSSKAEVRKQLIAFGYSSIEADEIVEDVVDWRRKNGGRSPAAPAIANDVGNGNSGNTNMLIGGGICLLGIVITVGSCMASQQGGSYTIAYGAIIWGAIQFFRGMSQSNQSDP